ncbi:hypothetical protein AZ78_5203 [Lysobacter capsici AZ78]|uniref:Uncharacterized protein n=1 Tax=Lysobacter capsici AZ78 TaxID=1444315 RepID=A0A125TZI6_9GAMM|nr:hypothetical protein AZ78_5203 [Lysobacter capsici AZ78]
MGGSIQKIRSAAHGEGARFRRAGSEGAILQWSPVTARGRPGDAPDSR